MERLHSATHRSSVFRVKTVRSCSGRCRAVEPLRGELQQAAEGCKAREWSSDRSVLWDQGSSQRLCSDQGLPSISQNDPSTRRTF